MANIYAKSLTFPGLSNTYLFAEELLRGGTELEEGSCVNGLKDSGRYYYSDASTILGDVPCIGYTVVIVIQTGGGEGEVTQIAFGNYSMYIRSYDGQAWNSWSSIGQETTLSSTAYGATVPTSGTEGQVFYKLT